MMDGKPTLIEFHSRSAMVARLSEYIEAELARGQLDNGRASLAVSGGSSPKPLYERLASSSVNWRNTTITLVDERWVDHHHPRSNEAFVRSCFKEAKGADIIGLYAEHERPADAVDEVTRRFARVAQPFDVVALGLGPDGHTASWFPNADGLQCALTSDRSLCAVTAQRSDVTGEEVERMTLTLSAVKSARRIILMIAGDEKRNTIEAAVSEGADNDMPVRAIMKARPDMWIAWAP